MPREATQRAEGGRGRKPKQAAIGSNGTSEQLLKGRSRAAGQGSAVPAPPKQSALHTRTLQH